MIPPFSIQEGKGNLEIRFRWEGKQRSISSGTKAQKEAQGKAPALIMAWIAARSKEVRAHPFQAAAEEFITEQYADHKPDTRAEVDLVLRRLARAFPGLTSLHELTPQVFRSGAGRLRGDASPKYWANILSIVRKFSRWAVARGYLPADPTEGIPFPGKSSFGRREEVWPEAYFEEVIGVVSAFDAEVLTLMRWTGIDSGDIYRLGPKFFVQDETGALTLRKRREKAKVEDETIIQPLSSRVRPFIEARLKSGEWYGAGYASVRSFTASLRKRVQTVMLRRGLAVRDLKSLRHSFASFHAERGVPIDVLRRWMGHARDSRILERFYVHRASTARFMD